MRVLGRIFKFIFAFISRKILKVFVAKWPSGGHFTQNAGMTVIGASRGNPKDWEQFVKSDT